MVRNVIIAAVLLIVLGLVWVAMTSYRPEGTTPAATTDVEQAREAEQGLAQLWLDAVRNDRPADAMTLAEAIAPPEDRAEANAEYIRLGRSERIVPRFFTDPFNRWDHQAWRDAVFFRDQARRAAAGREDEIKALVAALREVVRPRSAAPDVIPWPRNIWEHGAGVCDRMAWLTCELAYQLGYETQIVYLVDPKTKESPHTACELRKADGRVWFVDPYFGFVLTGKSAESVAQDRELAKSLWPGKEAVQAAIRNCVFFTPAYPSDYCPRNQLLAVRLKAALGDECPRFGEDPGARVRTYGRLWTEASGKVPSFDVYPWLYPFALMYRQIVEEMPARPAGAAGEAAP